MRKGHRIPPALAKKIAAEKETGGKPPFGPEGPGGPGAPGGPGGSFGPGGPGGPPDMGLGGADGFDEIAFKKSESGKTMLDNQKLMKTYKEPMQDEVLAYWAEHGVKKELFDTERDNGLWRYGVHTPLEMKEGEVYPLIYFSHAGMGNPYQAECTGYSKLVESEKIIVVYPNNGGFSNEEAMTEFPRIMSELREKGYPIDWSRVYAVGFSAGSDATETIGTLWPEMVAAVAPCPGSNAMYNSLCRITEESFEKAIPLKVPMICVGGTQDGGDTYPFPDQECFDNFNIWMERISKVKDYKPMNLEESKALIASTDDPAKKAVGVDFQKTYTIHKEDREWYVGEYFDENGVANVRFVIGEGIPHITTDAMVEFVWDFLKHWSRNPETGESIYKQEA
jgi:poly(3-hydroxybutyrate) depolymerase